MRDPIPTHAFALVVVRLGRRFLVVKERQHGQRWYLPAGRAEPGESFVDAARRETLEESGVPVVVEGILRIEHSPSVEGPTRWRVVFVARPADDTEPRATEDSLIAAWVTLEELGQLDLRGEEDREIFEYVAAGGAVHPLSMLVPEGTGWASTRR